MTKSDLEKWRFRAPYFIVSNAAIPLVIGFISDMDAQAKMIQLVVVPVSLGIAFVYSMVRLRDSEWYRELNRHVAALIRSELLALIPAELQVTDDERRRLSEKEIWKKLTGVFWEAIDSDAELKEQKQHFYANGVFYTSAIDLYILLPPFSLLYSGLYLYRQEPLFIIWATVCVFVAVLSRALFVPSRRKRHLELSGEQLDLLKRKKREFVSDRYSEIVTDWRQEMEAQPEN